METSQLIILFFRYPSGFLEKFAHVAPYLRRMEKRGETSSIDKARTYMVVCVTCHRQLIKDGPSRFKRNFKQLGFVVPPLLEELASLIPIERREISLIQPLGRIYRTQVSIGSGKFLYLVQFILLLNFLEGYDAWSYDVRPDGVLHVL